MTTSDIFSKSFLKEHRLDQKIESSPEIFDFSYNSNLILQIKDLAQCLKDLSKRYETTLSKVELTHLYGCLDITTLGSLDTEENVHKMWMEVKDCEYAPAAICVFPVFTKLCAELLKGTSIKLAVVEDAFPHGQSPIESRVFSVKQAVMQGAQEIDMVIRRGLALSENYSQITEEVKRLKEASGNASLKVILNTTEMTTGKDPDEVVFSRVYNSSIAALKGGADMLKTSTGKEGQVANLEHSIVMFEAIKRTKISCGFKAAGGVRSIGDALGYYFLSLLYNDEKPTNKIFRIGASALASEIKTRIG